MNAGLLLASTRPSWSGVHSQTKINFSMPSRTPSPINYP